VKIVQIITELRPAGAERIVAELAKGLVVRGHKLTVISLFPLPANSGIVDELQESGVVIKSLNLTFSSLWRIFKLGKILDEIKPDIVHSHLFHAGLTVRLNSGNDDFKFFSTVHISEKRKSRQWYFLADRLSIKPFECTTAVSLAVRNYYSLKTGIPSDKIPVVYNGIIPPPHLSEHRVSALREEWGMSDCDRVIGCVGRLDWQKGFDILLDFFYAERLRFKGIKLGIVILGEGRERVKLEKTASALNSHKIKTLLPGFRADAASCIGAFDLFVMPSRYEGFGLSLAEAMSHGVPILSSAADSLPELLVSYPNGECIDFERDGATLIAEKIKELAGRTKIIYKVPYTVDNMIDGYMKLYSKDKD